MTNKNIVLGCSSSSAPRLSIIIATWNAQQTLRRCLQSIVGQKFKDWEILVADGCSVDGTVDIVREYGSSIAWWQSKADEGIYDAWNQALVNARGEYVTFLGADDVLHSPETLSNIFSAIGEVRYDLITCRGQLRSSSGAAKQIIGSSWDDSKLPRRIRVCHPGMLHHRSLFEKFGLFNQKFKIAADFEFLLRLPDDVKNKDLDMVVVDIQDDGISRRHFWRRIAEYREIHSASPKVGSVKAWIYWADKAWRRPIALLLGLPH